jgi:hypothetical protein
VRAQGGGAGWRACAISLATGGSDSVANVAATRAPCEAIAAAVLPA